MEGDERSDEKMNRRANEMHEQRAGKKGYMHAALNGSGGEIYYSIRFLPLRFHHLVSQWRTEGRRERLFCAPFLFSLILFSAAEQTIDFAHLLFSL